MSSTFEEYPKYKSEPQLTNPNISFSFQRRVFDTIIQHVETETPCTMMPIGPGVSGKTFTYNTILEYVRGLGKVAISVASTGISSLLLEGGTTAHSRFKIPLHLDEWSSCNLAQDSPEAEVLKAAALVCWDEAPVMSRYAFEAVHKYFCELMRTPLNIPFGGKVMLLGGDFRQTLPVIPHGSTHQILEQSLFKSELWKTVNVMHLQINMRVQRVQAENLQEAQRLQCFSDILLSIGNDALPHIELPLSPPDYITLPKEFCLPLSKSHDENIANLFHKTYPDLQNNYRNMQWMLERAILAPLNSTVQETNDWAVE
jgi:hypothetical protein